MMSENDLLPENNGKVSENEENVFVQKFENNFILEITNWYSMYFSRYSEVYSNFFTQYLNANR